MRPLVLASVLSLAACPGSPEFQPQDGSTTTTDTEVATETASPTETTETTETIETIEDITVGTDTEVTATDNDADVADVDTTPPTTPCESNCTDRITQDEALMVAGVVDHAGRAHAAIVLSDGGAAASLSLWSYRAPDEWDSVPVDPDVDFALDVALAEDARHRLHLMLEHENDGPSATTWFRPSDAGWTRDVLLDEARCERPAFRTDTDGSLFGSCVVIDDGALVIRELTGTDDSSYAWSTAFELSGIGFVQSRNPRVLSARWDFLPSGFPHVSNRCCTLLGSNVHYYAWNGTSWPHEDLGSHATNINITDVAIDAAGRPHVIYVEYDNEQSVARIIDRFYGDGSWQFLIVDTTSTSSFGAGLQVEADVEGRLHLIYRDDVSLAYRRFDGDAWGLQRNNALEVDGTLSTALLIEGTRAHVVFTDVSHEAWWWVPPTTP